MPIFNAPPKIVWTNPEIEVIPFPSKGLQILPTPHGSEGVVPAIGSEGVVCAKESMGNIERHINKNNMGKLFFINFIIVLKVL
jgi:hypothetical protein